MYLLVGRHFCYVNIYCTKIHNILNFDTKAYSGAIYIRIRS